MITVIVPVYNVEKYIERCLDSVLGQTYTNLEIILVDDGSVDSSGIICDNYAEKDTRIKVIHKENGGLSSARNVGLDHATGKYIAFLDSDDCIDCETFQKCIGRLKNTGADICMFSHFTVNRARCIEHALPFTKDIYKGEEIRRLILPKFFGKTSQDSEVEGFVCRQIFKKEIIGETRFRSERDYFAEDVVFDLEVYNKIDSFCVVNEPLYFYYYVQTSLSNKYRKDVFQKLERLLLFMESFARENALVDVKKRILATAFRFALYSCRNTKRAQELSFSKKRCLIKGIANNRFTVEAVRTLKFTSFKEKVFAWLLKRKMAGLILALV